jgi:acetyl-CoA carboxylase biotin carboxyl carrier protein
MTNAGNGGGDIFDVKKVRRLVELMEEHDLAEIDLRQADQRIRLRRGMDPQYGPAPAYPPPVAHPPASHGAPTASSSPAPSAAESSSGVTINSPMVGTFYSGANPDSPPFAKVGDHVGPESVVCIIEAMKVFNEIQAEVAGQVVAVLVENGQPVEFGQPLFKIAPHK